jgi:hypothetical protein
MISAVDLGLWLAVDPGERSRALGDLVEAGDLRFVAAGDGITVTKTHTNDLARLEIGPAPILPLGSA